MPKEVSAMLLGQASAVKEAVKAKIIRMNTHELQRISTQRLVTQAIGPAEMLDDGSGVRWNRGFFPQVPEDGCHSVGRWHRKLTGVYREEYLASMCIYYAALSTSCTGSHHLISRRLPKEAWVADYNPYCL